MATQFSTEITALNAGTALKPNQREGRVRIAQWSFTTPAGGVPINDVVILTKVPKGARVIQGREFHAAMSTGAAVATVDIGTYTKNVDGTYTVAAVGAFLAATSVDAAGQNELANTLALGALGELTNDDEIYVGAKATVEAWAAAANFQGYLLYVGRD